MMDLLEKGDDEGFVASSRRHPHAEASLSPLQLAQLLVAAAETYAPGNLNFLFCPVIFIWNII